MIWLTWRQARIQLLVVLAAVMVLAVLLAVTAPQLVQAHEDDPTGFLKLVDTEAINRTLYLAGIAALYVVPPVIGAFWGAPMIARELETGSHRLVWNQTITRRRWLTTKLGVTALAALAATGLLTVAVTVWSNPIDTAIEAATGTGIFNTPRVAPPTLGARGVVPLGYTAFALALGVALGLVLRRSVPAIAITLAAVAALQILMPTVIREHLVEPSRLTTTITQENLRGMMLSGPEDNAVLRSIEVKAGGPGDWRLSNQTVSADGTVLDSLPAWVRDCGPPHPDKPAQTPQARAACFTRLADEGYRQVVASHPPSHFWALQWRETGILLGLATLLTGFVYWRIRRDLS